MDKVRQYFASYPLVGFLPQRDEQVIADTLRRILALSGYEAQAVDNAEQAVAAAAQSPPDVLVSDVVMGDMNGIDAARTILQICLECHVILCSGQATTARLCANAHIDGQRVEILSKPVSPQNILDRQRAWDTPCTSRPSKPPPRPRDCVR
jgi:DNA-binding NtrC family response regulator